MRTYSHRNLLQTAFSFACAVATATSVLVATVIGGLLVRGIRRDPDDPQVWFAHPWLWLVVGAGVLVVAGRMVRQRFARRASDGNLTAANDSSRPRVPSKP